MHRCCPAAGVSSDDLTGLAEIRREIRRLEHAQQRVVAGEVCGRPEPVGIVVGQELGLVGGHVHIDRAVLTNLGSWRGWTRCCYSWSNRRSSRAWCG